ncbi:hypothetical protein B0T21DRAFT_413250 [Apiosordaria backusii]|uniref:Uncharacterized protein n=1 Tax=Apiosordaria backusii TaxID=314023 RepID=A0AA40E5N6_9PEZI|nr:hypothetical protein B0T21DRAFT_413250 [Apiosordaria backusii]
MTPAPRQRYARLKPPAQADESGEASGSRTPPLGLPPPPSQILVPPDAGAGAGAGTRGAQQQPHQDYGFDHLALTSIRYISSHDHGIRDVVPFDDNRRVETAPQEQQQDQNRIPEQQQQQQQQQQQRQQQRGFRMRFGRRRHDAKLKGVERTQCDNGHIEDPRGGGGGEREKRGYRRRFKSLSARLRKLCGFKSKPDEGKGKMPDMVVEDPPPVIQDGVRYRGSDMMHVVRPGHLSSSNGVGVVPAGSSSGVMTRMQPAGVGGGGGGGGVLAQQAQQLPFPHPHPHAYPMASSSSSYHHHHPQVRTMGCQLPVSTMTNEIHPALRPRPGEEVGFLSYPPKIVQQQPGYGLATVQEASALPASGFVPVMTSAVYHSNHGYKPNVNRRPSESSILSHHHHHHHRYNTGPGPRPPHQQVIITSPHPIADTYTHEEDWSHVRQAQALAAQAAARAKASQQTMYTTTAVGGGLAPRPSQRTVMMANTHVPLAIPERRSSRWRGAARSFMSGSFRSRSRNRSACGSFDSRTSWNPFDLPGPPRKTLMSDMESLLAGRSSRLTVGESRDGGHDLKTGGSSVRGGGGGVDGSRSSTPAGMVGGTGGTGMGIGMGMGIMGGKRSQASIGTVGPASSSSNIVNNRGLGGGVMQTQFPWPLGTTQGNDKTGGSETGSGGGGMGLRVDRDGFMMPALPPKPQLTATTASTPTPTPAHQASTTVSAAASMIPVQRTPSTATNPTLGRNPSQKTDNGSNTGTTWTGTGSSTLNNPGVGLQGLGKARTKSSASTARTGKTGGRVDEEEVEGEEGGDGVGGVKDRVEVYATEAKVGGFAGGRGKKKGSKGVS